VAPGRESGRGAGKKPDRRWIDLAVDSTGLRNGRRSQWYILRLGRRVSRREFDKLHLACNVRPRHKRAVLLVYDWQQKPGSAGCRPRSRGLVAKAREFGRLRAVMGGLRLPLPGQRPARG